jgi:uncharacterized protein (DUF2126 family)
MKAALYENDAQAQQHARVMASIAEDLGCPLEEVARIYEAELARFIREARIRDFLPILVSRSVRELLAPRARNVKEAPALPISMESV